MIFQRKSTTSHCVKFLHHFPSVSFRLDYCNIYYLRIHDIARTHIHPLCENHQAKVYYCIPYLLLFPSTFNWISPIMHNTQKHTHTAQSTPHVLYKRQKRKKRQIISAPIPKWHKHTNSYIMRVVGISQKSMWCVQMYNLMLNANTFLTALLLQFYHHHQQHQNHFYSYHRLCCFRRRHRSQSFSN